MNTSNVIDLESVRGRRAARSFGVDFDRRFEPTEMERAAFSFFHAITNALDDGAQPEQVDRLVDRMDLMLRALEREPKGKEGQRASLS